MKDGLLRTTALAGTCALLAGGTVYAAEAPEWQLSGNMNFQFYHVDQDFIGFNTEGGDLTWAATEPTPDFLQDHGWYFGVDEAELTLNVSGAADNGLNYGFKIELDANTSGSTNADEARIEFSGSWGTLQLGDEDGAEDIMNYGGEDLMGATGGFDGDFDDVLIRQLPIFPSNAISYPTIAGDTDDASKVSYFSPRFSGFQVGASLTPTPNTGDNFKADGDWENHYGLGVNYDNSFGDISVRASAVYSAASDVAGDDEDTGAWSVGGIVGWGPVSLGANYTDNGDSGQFVGSGDETWYWNVAAGFETGALYFSVGYFESTKEHGSLDPDSTFTNFAITADYTVAPGLGMYAEIDLIEDDLLGSQVTTSYDNDATVFIMGANVSF